MLPECWALSDKEAVSIRAFLKTGTNRLLCEGAPGLFDEHGKLRSKGAIEDMVPPRLGISVAADSESTLSTNSAGGAAYAADRINGKTDWSRWVASQLHSDRAPVQVAPATCTRVHRYRLGKYRLLAFERNINYQMSEELKQAGGNEPLEKPAEIQARLSEPAHVYNLRTEEYLGRLDQITFKLDPWQPALFALTPEKVTGSIVEMLGRP